MKLDSTRKNADFQLLQRVSNWDGPNQLCDLDDGLLRELSRNQGVDFATALLYRAICESPVHSPFVHRVEELLQEVGTFRGKIDATLVIVPGAFYREHPETGADGKHLCRVAESLGCRAHVIPAESLGTPTVNGRIICDWLDEASEQTIILCSLSKGSADVRMAFDQPASSHAFRNVAAWLNVGGTTAGSPMASWLLDRPLLTRIYRTLFYLRGHDFQFVLDLERRASAKQAKQDVAVLAPATMKTVHVLGFPLSHHIRRSRTRRWHRRLACYGPNDGATILADSCQIPGLIFPAWGADHYFDTQPSSESLLAALLRYLADELNLYRNEPCVRSAATKGEPVGVSPRMNYETGG